MIQPASPRGQEDHGRGDVPDLADSTERRLRLELLAEVAVREPGGAFSSARAPPPAIGYWATGVGEAEPLGVAHIGPVRVVHANQPGVAKLSHLLATRRADAQPADGELASVIAVWFAGARLRQILSTLRLAALL